MKPGGAPISDCHATQQFGRRQRRRGTGEDYQSYASPQDFTNSYVSMIQRKYPQATNTGSDANAYVAGLKQGGYFTSDLTTYQNNVSSTASSIAGNSNYQTSTASSQPTISYKGYNADGMFLGETADPTTLPITGATRYEALTAGGGFSGNVPGARLWLRHWHWLSKHNGAASSAPTPAANAPTAQALKDMLTRLGENQPAERLLASYLSFSSVHGRRRRVIGASRLGNYHSVVEEGKRQ